MHLNRPLCFGAAASGLIFIAAASVASATQPPRLQIKQTEDAIFPRTLLVSGVNYGEVWVTISLDADGTLTDALPNRYTARPLADEALRLLRKWTFEPVRVNGRTIPVCTEVHLTFHATGAIVTLDPVLDQNRKSTLPARLDCERAIVGANELDQPPMPVYRIQPALPDGAALGNGKVVIDFIIDELGCPRMPVLVSAPSPELGNRMGDALMQWRFSQPLRNGKPVAARVRQEFLLTP